MNRVVRSVGRPARQARRHAEQLAVSATDRLRRGGRTVLMTPRTGLRLGNLLYVWLQAHRRTLAGAPTLALEAPAMAQWLAAFPELRALTIAKTALRFHDRREWDAEWLYQRFGTDFAGDDIAMFVADTIAHHVDPDRTGTLVINVRRGDYYSAEFADKYSFDQPGYLDAALGRLRGAERALVVSDDPEWCRANLDALIRSRIGAVEYAAPDPLANFLTVAAASRIIGTNSTFTYWAAYVAGVIHPAVEVVMPRFHARMRHGTDAHQLDPRWTVLDGFH